MTAAASDRWSPVSVRWGFGDGATAAGGAVSHVFGAPGAFGVAATATDATGNATTATRSLLVGAPPTPPAAAPTPRIDTPVQTLWGVAGKRLFLLRLKATRVPRGTKLALRCKGDRCPEDRSSTKRRGGGITLFKALPAKQAAKAGARGFRAGQRLDVRVTAPGQSARSCASSSRRAGSRRARCCACRPAGRSRGSAAEPGDRDEPRDELAHLRLTPPRRADYGRLKDSTIAGGRTVAQG